MNNILTVEGLCKSYSRFSLRDIGFELPAGYVMGLIGPNGAGKTTTIKSIFQAITPDSGSIHIFGNEVTAQNVSLREDIGIVLDQLFYIDEWTISDVERALSPFYGNWDSQKYASYIQSFHLEPSKKLKELSRGMKIKLMISVALSHDAKLLILDEPTSGLDPVARNELMEILRDFVQDETRGVLFSTHITSDLEKVADYITFILNGKVEYSGETQKLLENFVIIKGGPEELSPTLREKLIGIRSHSVGFEGLFRREDLSLLPPGVHVEAPSLDEIIIYMNKEAGQHE